jgi:hypothetical protein
MGALVCVFHSVDNGGRLFFSPVADTKKKWVVLFQTKYDKEFKISMSLFVNQ